MPVVELSISDAQKGNSETRSQFRKPIMKAVNDVSMSMLYLVPGSHRRWSGRCCGVCAPRGEETLAFLALPALLLPPPVVAARHKTFFMSHNEAGAVYMSHSFIIARVSNMRGFSNLSFSYGLYSLHFRLKESFVESQIRSKSVCEYFHAQEKIPWTESD